MSYHRGEPYVWNDELDMHIWSNLREGETGYASAVRVELGLFDQIAISRVADLMRQGWVPPALTAAMKKMGGRFEEEMQRARRAKK